MQVSDMSVSTILQIGAVVVGLSLAWGASKAQDAAQDSRITALEKRIADDKKERDDRMGWMMRAWQRRDQPTPVCTVAAPRG
jgi:hypothetical protein